MLDRLLTYEKPLKSSSDEDSSSEEEVKRKFSDQKPAKRRKIVEPRGLKQENLEKEAIEKLQARMGSSDNSMVTSTFSTLPQELFSNEPSMDSTYGEM